jgi:hypothetical protein
MSKVQQMMAMDEIEVASIGQMWMEAIVNKLGLKGKPGSEITCQNVTDSNITTLWHKNQPVAIAIRQRNDWNWCVLTLVEVEPMKASPFSSPKSDGAT